jgi:predicted TIM-barrel fold metal-dependent hydrolase
MIFEGVFERFPRLKVVLVELGWSWAVPFAWRLDHAYRVMGREVPHLERLPSEYLRDHFWYTTQPMEEPERRQWLDEVFDSFEASGMADKLLFSSDYPHWDFDEPGALPSTLGLRQKREILGGNAHTLYGIELIPGQGWSPRPRVDAEPEGWGT